MSELAVITPSYASDAELFGDLHASVLEQTPPRTVHHAVVPSVDRALFTRYASPRCRIWTYPELLRRPSSSPVWNSRRNCGRSCGVLISRMSRMPANISTDRA